MADTSGPDEHRGKTYTDLDMSGAEFREVNLAGARMRGVLLFNADIDGAIDGLRINGVEVTPLIEAELDRRHPERTRLRPATVAAAGEAVDVVEAMWAETITGAHAMPAEAVHRSVDGEWSLTETLRHLIFVADAWFGHAVLRESRPFHPAGLPPSFIDGAAFGIDAAADPSFPDVVALHRERLASVRVFLATATDADLDRVREPNEAPGFPPPQARTAVECLGVLFNEEWAHHQFAIRDLALLVDHHGVGSCAPDRPSRVRPRRSRSSAGARMPRARHRRRPRRPGRDPARLPREAGSRARRAH